jgi:rSAM/selenodomain-associated transferase 1
MNVEPDPSPIPDKSVILLFIKAPVEGMVKSRLAGAIGEKTATELYKNFLLDGIEAVEKTGYPFKICVYPPEAETTAASWLGNRYVYLSQKGEDLGERMENAFHVCFSEGYERAILIGSDLPDLEPEVLHGALRSLDKSDVVIGPAFDGGYYLIGFTGKAFFPDLFRGIRWGANTVFGETMSILRASGLTVHQAPMWNDVDTVEDLQTLCSRSAGTAFDNSRTMTYLRKNKLMCCPTHERSL